jgi:tripartite-type tricarboxylate transporter receptor subunit TctC
MLNTLRLSTLVGSLVMAASAMAADYPTKPIEVIVGFAPGGGTDVMARTVGPYLEKYLGSGATVVIKNVPGASGQIGITQTAKAKPDGYTLGTYNLPGMMARTLDRESEYTAASFTYVANVVNDPNVIVTSKKSGLDTLDKLIKAAKEKPGSITVGMSSLGGDDHFALTKFQGLTQTEYTIVPFKGSAPARTALMGGHVAMGILNISEVADFADQINIVGVAQATRSEFAPDVPTFKEQGVNLLNGALRGFVAPAGLPEDVRKKLLAAFTQMAKDPEFLKAMKATANPVEMSVGDDFKALNDELLGVAKTTWEKSPWK